ncbi:Small ribosomal subunit protein bS20 [Candidatus Xenohaliotis californiensis]|uniref:Small ribosomal subunit protein bS20 n=1 Tax=Candidatus Xenohaliotis californiensis TaxID=84677 RepID=A0ABP0ESK8_9RICK|nr:Small ribosomal subunit protein bS20 [Candidatus Xenohaliotis californiensis]
MSNTHSAKKMIRKIINRASRNKAIKSKYKTFIKKVEKAILSGDKAKAQEEFKLAQPIMQSSHSKGVYKLNTVSRKIKKLSAKIKAMPGAFIVGGGEA